MPTIFSDWDIRWNPGRSERFVYHLVCDDEPQCAEQFDEGKRCWWCGEFVPIEIQDVALLEGIRYPEIDSKWQKKHNITANRLLEESWRQFKEWKLTQK